MTPSRDSWLIDELAKATLAPLEWAHILEIASVALRWALENEKKDDNDAT